MAQSSEVTCPRSRSKCDRAGILTQESGVRACALSPHAAVQWKESPGLETVYDLLLVKKIKLPNSDAI